MKKLYVITAIVTSVIFYACSGGETKSTESTTASETQAAAPERDDVKRGIGKFTKVDILATLDKTMADAGHKIAEGKCLSCHKLTDERLVGPGWSGITSRRTPEWIMNFATNTEEMLAKDAVAQAQLEICLVRMPNQNLSDEDVRKVYEFMRMNDGVK